MSALNTSRLGLSRGTEGISEAPGTDGGSRVGVSPRSAVYTPPPGVCLLLLDTWQQTAYQKLSSEAHVTSVTGNACRVNCSR